MLSRWLTAQISDIWWEEGTDIEDLAKKISDKIMKTFIATFTRITDKEAANVVNVPDPEGAVTKECIEQAKQLYNLFCVTAGALQIRQWDHTTSTQLVAAYAKLNVRDNATFPQKKLLLKTTQEKPGEIAAAQTDLNNNGLDAEIGGMVTMNSIKLQGDTSANVFVRGGSTSEKQVGAFKLWTVGARIMVFLATTVATTFGGIVKWDVSDWGVMDAATQVELTQM